MTAKPIAAGKSSYELIDTERFWQTIAVKAGMTVLDLGCGSGRYSLGLAQRMAGEGRIVAVDLWSEGIEQLTQETVRSGSGIIEPYVADAGKSLPLESASVDLCLMATALHDFVAEGNHPAVLDETLRVLKPQGILAIVEFKKQEGPPGPPKKIRLSVEDLAVMLQPRGFLRFSAVSELGPDIYMTQFRRLGRRTP